MLTTSWFLALGACADWPRFSHLPSPTDAREAGVDSGVVDDGDIDWFELPPTIDDNQDNSPLGLPVDVLAPGHGYWSRTTLVGSGRDAAAVPARDEACGRESAFPPEEAGDYLGDVDWRVIEFTGAGTLCSVFELDDPDTRADVLLYTLDECGLPVVVARDGDGRPFGWNVESPDVTWHWPVLEPVIMGLVVGGRLPDDPEALLVYTWSVSLLPPAGGEASTPVVCPIPEEAG